MQFKYYHMYVLVKLCLTEFCLCEEGLFLNQFNQPAFLFLEVNPIICLY